MPASAAPRLPVDSISSTGLLQTLLATAVVAVAVLRPLYEDSEATIRDFAWVYLNPAGQQQLQQLECPTASLLTLFPTAKTDGLFATCCQAFTTGEAQRHQTYYQADGLASYFVLAAQRCENALVINFTQSNERSPAAEEALGERQARAEDAEAAASRQRQELTALFQQAPASIAHLSGPTHVFTLVNPGYQQLVGDRPLLGLPLASAFPEFVGPSIALLDQVYQTGEPYYGHEVPADYDRTNSGRAERAYVNFIYQATRDAAGTVTGVLLFAYDVTEQVVARQQVQTLNEELAASNEELRANNDEYLKSNASLGQAQQELRQLNHDLEGLVQARTQQVTQYSARLTRLLAEAPAAICMVDGPELVFELVNPGYQQLFPDRELLGKSVFDALPEIVGGPVEDMLRGVYQTGTTFEGREVLMQFARPGDGQLVDRYFNFIYQARYDEAGEIDGLVVFAFEVSEQVQSRQHTQRLHDEMQATNTQLRRTNADLDTFVYTASHDLKAPIANIEGLLDVLLEYLPTQEQEPMVPRLVGMMQAAIARFQQTVGHLTDVSHLQQVPDQPQEDIDLSSLIEGVRLDLVPLVESTQAHLLVEVAECPRLRFATKTLRSIVYNLLSNAIKYRAPQRAPVVQVRSRCSAAHFVLEVQDNGLGLSEEQQAKLFTLFKRLHTHVEGSGVGLYMIKRLIENAGGTITVHSQLEVGSTFIVTLPRT
ncbi:MAG: PAS domain-containing protein [Hymenobacter sp.]|nr:MAG: PAS domain-containing protein [Hymenobacter sp.]